jgi:hypothetical protein
VAVARTSTVFAARQNVSAAPGTDIAPYLEHRRTWLPRLTDCPSAESTDYTNPAATPGRWGIKTRECKRITNVWRDPQKPRE